MTTANVGKHRADHLPEISCRCLNPLMIIAPATSHKEDCPRRIDAVARLKLGTGGTR